MDLSPSFLIGGGGCWLGPSDIQWDWCKAKHADKIAEMGIYLDTVDLLVWTKFHAPGKEVFICVDLPTSDPLEPSNLVDYIRGMCQSEALADAELLRRPDAITGSWRLIMCRADFEFKSGSVLNHWVAALVEEEEGATVYEAVTRLQDIQMEENMSKVMRELMDLEEPDPEDPLVDALTTEVYQASLNQEMESLERYSEFVKRCRLKGMSPLHTPADGNCMLWALKILQDATWDESEASFGPGQLKVIESMRQQVSMAWKFGQTNPELQLLLHHAFVEDHDEPMGPDGAASTTLKSEPVTPRRVKRLCPELIDLDTPPEAPPKAVKRVHGCRRACAWPKPKFDNEDLPAMSCPQPAPAGTAPEQEIEVPETTEPTEPADAPAPKRRRRSGKTRKLDERALQIRKTRLYIGHLQTSYQKWQLEHWKFIGTKKAGVCEDGKWSELVERLAARETEKIKCEVCNKFLKSIGFTFDGLDAYEPPAGSTETPDEDKPTEEQELEVDEKEGNDEQKQDGPLDEMALDKLVKKICPYFEVPQRVRTFFALDSSEPFFFSSFFIIYIHISSYIYCRYI